MPRRHGSNAFRRPNPEADKEKRNVKVIKAFRMLDGQDSAQLSGIVRDLERDQSLPPFRSIPNTHTVYVLDPHTVRKEFSMGFRSGQRFEAERAKQKMRASPENGSPITSDNLEAEIGKITLLGRSEHHKNTLVAYVESTPLVEERRALYEILGEEGLKGFTRLKHRSIGAPYILLGTTIEPIHDVNARERIIDVVETATLIHAANHVALGQLQVV